jgi:hypothetical protein
MQKSLKTMILVLFTGLIIGSVFGEVVGLFLEEGSVAHQLFVRSISFGPDLNRWHLLIVDVTFGFKIHVNLMSVIGIFISSQLLRWYR